MTPGELAQLRRETLRQLAEAGGGYVTPRAVLDAARSPESPLHGLFTWDDSEAAEKWRVAQAEGYLRAVVTVIPRDGEDRVVRAMVSLSTDRGTGAYRPIEDVLGNQVMRETMVRDAMQELRRVQQKHKHLSELASVWHAIELVDAA